MNKTISSAGWRGRCGGGDSQNETKIYHFNFDAKLLASLVPTGKYSSILTSGRESPGNSLFVPLRSVLQLFPWIRGSGGRLPCGTRSSGKKVFNNCKHNINKRELMETVVKKFPRTRGKVQGELSSFGRVFILPQTHSVFIIHAGTSIHLPRLRFPANTTSVYIVTHSG